MNMTLNLNSARIEHSEFYNNQHYTVVTTPAPDAFSHPARFRLQSQQPLGTQHQTVDIVVQVTGLVREKQYRDKNTGQMKQFNEGVVFLNVVSCSPSKNIQPAQQVASAGTK